MLRELLKPPFLLLFLPLLIHPVLLHALIQQITFLGGCSVTQAAGKKPHPSSLGRLPMPGEVLPLLLPGSREGACPALLLTAGRCWRWPLLGSCRESINEGEQIPLQVGRDRPEHPSVKQGPHTPKKVRRRQGPGQAEEGCWARAHLCSFLAADCEIRQVFLLFPSTKTCQDALSQNAR